MKIAILVSGRLNNYDLFNENLKSRLGGYDYDVFVYTSKFNNNARKGSEENTKKEIKKAYGNRLKAQIFMEDDKKFKSMYDDRLEAIKKSALKRFNSKRLKKNLSQIESVLEEWLMFHQVVNMMDKYKKKRKRKYDIIVKLDPNVLYYDNFDFEGSLSLIQGGTLILPYSEKDTESVEILIMMNYENALKLKDVYLTLYSKFITNRESQIFASQKNLAIFLKENNFNATHHHNFNSKYRFKHNRNNSPAKYLKSKTGLSDKELDQFCIMSSKRVRYATSEEEEKDEDLSSGSSDLGSLQSIEKEDTIKVQKTIDDKKEKVVKIQKTKQSKEDESIELVVGKAIRKKNKNAIIKIIRASTWEKVLSEVNNRKKKKGLLSRLKKRPKIFFVFIKEKAIKANLEVICKTLTKYKIKLIVFNPATKEVKIITKKSFKL